jgi:hypothetical protein
MTAPELNPFRNPAWTDRPTAGPLSGVGRASIPSRLTTNPPYAYDPPAKSHLGPRHAGFR